MARHHQRLAIARCALLIGVLVGGSLVPRGASATSSPAFAPPTDVAARWAFDEGAGTALHESVSGAVDGQTVGGASWIAGADGSGHALSFDGVNGIASIQAEASQRQQVMSVTFWARATLPGADRVLVAETGSDCSSSWEVSTGTTGTLDLTAWTTTGEAIGVTSSVPPTVIWDGEWHVLGVTMSFDPEYGLEARTYVDGIAGGATTGGIQRQIDYSAPDASFVVGGPAPGCAPERQFHGDVDDVRIYDRVLGSDEMGSFVPQIPTTISLTSYPTFAFCDAVWNTATISPAPLNGGWVDFFVDDGSGPALITSAWASGGTITLIDGCFPIGNDTLSARFRGWPPYLASTSDPVPITVVKRPSRIYIQTSAYPVPVGTDAVIWITADPGSGTVDLFETTGGMHRLVVGGLYTRTASVSGLSVGDHDFVAQYNGDAQTLPSTSDPLRVTVAPDVPPVARITTLPVFLATSSIGLSWGATPGSGAITFYDVRYRRAPWNGAFGSYAMWLSGTAATSRTFAAVSGNTYCFSARAHDSLGSVSAWTAETCTAAPLDDRSLTRYGSWFAGTSASYYGSTYLRSSSAGAKLVRTGMVARRMALLATTCSTCGSVRVYWGSTYLRTVSLYSATTHYRVLLPVTTFASARTGALTLIVNSTSRSVIIDGVVIRRN